MKNILFSFNFMRRDLKHHVSFFEFDIDNKGSNYEANINIMTVEFRFLNLGGI
jgi:hypothetical protein